MRDQKFILYQKPAINPKRPLSNQELSRVLEIQYLYHENERLRGVLRVLIWILVFVIALCFYSYTNGV